MDYIVKAYKDWKLHSQFQEIVPDMDDSEFMFNEKQSIRDSSRTLKKYGSTCCHNMRNNETLIRHMVDKSDTLQGIALKYGCTTEQLRRANRLFASDSLFLRQFLLVPVEKNSPYYPQVGSDTVATLVDALATPPGTPDANVEREQHQNNANTLSQTNSGSSSSCNMSSSTSSMRSGSLPQNSMPPPPSPAPQEQQQQPQLHQQQPPQRPYSIAGELLVQSNDEDPALMHNHNACSSKQSKSLDSVAAMTPEEENRKCMNDFLNKIDNTISESRKYVERSKDMVSSQSDADICISINTDVFPQRRNNHLNNSYKNNNNNNNRPPHHQRHSSTGSGNSDTAQLLNTTQTRRVQNSLKRLEKQQDDFFEL